MMLWRLDYAPLWNPDEGRYASASLEMAHPLDGSAPNAVVPHLDTIPRLNKPPLVYWLGSLAFRLFGVSAWAGRLVPALAAIATLFLIYLLGRRMFNERAGIAGAMVWATTLFPGAMTRTMNTDMLLTCTMALVFGGIWLALEEAGPRGKWTGIALASAGSGLALLAKGPVGMALPLLLAFVYLLVARRWKRIPWLGVLVTVIVAFAIAAPWYLMMEQARPGFLQHFIVGENLGRFSGKQEFHDKQPIYYYLVVVIAGLLPWTAFLLPTCLRSSLRDSDESRRARLFLWIWGGVLIAFFSISSTKLISYALPAFPAFCLLIGETFGGISAADWREDFPEWIQGSILGIIAAMNAVIMVAGAIYLSNDKTLPRPEALPYIAALALVLVVTTAAAVLAWRTRNRWKLFLVQIAGAGALIILLLQLAARIAVYEDASAMILALRPYLQPEDRFLEYRTFQPTAIFYLRRPVPIYHFNNNSGLDETTPAFKSLFLGEEDFLKTFHSPQRTYILVRWNNHGHLKFPPQWRIIASNNDYRLISNRPAPPGFYFDYTAPKKRGRINTEAPTDE